MQPYPWTEKDDTVVDLIVTAGRLTRSVGEISADDLPRAIVRALAVLDHHGALRIGDFARIDRSSQPSATALIGRLVSQGYASRRRDPADSRGVLVELTPVGRARLAAFRAAVRNALSDRLAGFDTERLARMAGDLRELLAAIDTAAEQDSLPRTPS
ncbi:MarR family winged helix-turn-helix transcriptional regulator [Nocardia flavorosea]|uniref:MarR family transcriptional regulator n=1 Tax=Nocardia flavorosea TaxID=53429 RepID=A0A846YDV0_9NOCA|nr:MarR family transcriptional regulator [Nocardia flavorosea]NKY55920.1 MarR family transcriptional regulator [Nocardia flavorosea]